MSCPLKVPSSLISKYCVSQSRSDRIDTKYDIYFPEFAHLSDQPIYEGELLASGVSANNNTVFGYQGAWDFLRTRQDLVTEEMRVGQNYDHWHSAITFGSRPSLTSSFFLMDPPRRIFADTLEPSFIVNFGNILYAARPMPVAAVPGGIDHG